MSEPLKHCPICTKDLPVSEFGMCRARKDGKNLYCKSCIRQKVSDSRRALKEYKSIRRKHLVEPTEVEMQVYGSAKSPFKQSPVERVRDAIQRGFRTQGEIAGETKLGKDEIGDALAQLLLWTHEITTRIVDGTRMYFINHSVSVVGEAGPILPDRKRSLHLMEFASSELGPVMKHERVA